MAYVRELPNGKFQVCWRENARDEYGAPIAGQFVQRTETLTDEKQAERRKVAIELELESGHDPSASKSAALQPLAHYARMYVDALTGKIDDQTIDGYRDIYRVHIQPTFANRPTSSILPSDVDVWVSGLLSGDRSGSVRTKWLRTKGLGKFRGMCQDIRCRTASFKGRSALALATVEPPAFSGLFGP